MSKKNRKNLVIAIAMIMVLAVGAIAAYFTAQDTATNTFTFGKVDIDLLEPNWDPDDATEVTPNQELLKDPQIQNTGINDAFMFAVVQVPKAEIVTSAVPTGVQNGATNDGTANSNEGTAAMTQLFQLNKTADSAGAKAWTGTDTYNDDAWTLIATNPTGVPAAIAAANNVYVYAYTGSSSDSMQAVAADATTPEVFQSVTVCNAISEQGLEEASKDVKVYGFGVQTDNITAADTTAPAAVWAIVNAQDGALINLTA